MLRSILFLPTLQDSPLVEMHVEGERLEPVAFSVTEVFSMKQTHAFSRFANVLLLAGILGTMVAALLLAPASASAAAMVPGHTQPHQVATFRHQPGRVRPPAALPRAVDPPTCSRTGCNGLDPYRTYCAGQSWDSWWVVDSVPVSNWQHVRVGWLQLWWSRTCQTNWSRFVCTEAASACPYINDLELMEERSPGSQSGYGVQYVRDVFATDVRTKQAYLPAIRAQAHLMIDCTGQGCAGASTHWE